MAVHQVQHLPIKRNNQRHKPLSDIHYHHKAISGIQQKYFPIITQS